VAGVQKTVEALLKRRFVNEKTKLGAGAVSLTAELLRVVVVGERP
jgi:hypothetical protein